MQKKNVKQTDTDCSLLKQIKFLFQSELSFCVKAEDHKGFLFTPISFLDGIQITFPQLISNTKLETMKDFVNMKKRLMRVPWMLYNIGFD